MNNYKWFLFEEFASPEKRSIISGPFGSSISKKYFKEKGIPVIRGNNLSTDFIKFIDSGFVYVTEEKAKSLNTYAIIDDLVFTAVGTLGQVGLIHKNLKFEEYIISNKQLRVRIEKQKLYPDYAFYWFTSPWMIDTIQKRNVGSTVPLINLSIVRGLPICVPENIQTQKSIAKVLSDLDAKIELNNLINQELEAMAKTLYDYWFVQFDFPNEQGKPYKSSGGKMVYNEELKREIPEGWEVKKIKDFAKTGSGGTPLKSKKEFYDGGNIPWINSGEVNEPFIVSAQKYITQVGLDNSSAKIFKKGTILMAMYGATAGKVSFMDIEACTNQAICAINPKKDFYRTFTKLGLEDLYKYLVNLSSGSARDNLSQDKIRELKFVIPNNNLIEQFDKMVSSSMEKILINMKQNQQLTNLRNWLLPMLMNGQVTVRQAHGSPVGEAALRQAQDTKLNSSAELSRSMAAEPQAEYKKG